MNRQLLLTVLVACACSAPSVVRAEPLTIEQAENVSKATGRPIFAVAGSKT